MLKKTASKTASACRVTFKVAPSEEASSVAVLGDFNEWNPTAHLLTQRKDGSFSATLSLTAGESYRFRYLVDGETWLNDEQPDGLVENRYGGLDCVVQT